MEKPNIIVHHIVPGAKRYRGKKKRLQKKWLKKNTEFVTTYKGVEVVGYTETYPSNFTVIQETISWKDIRRVNEKEENK